MDKLKCLKCDHSWFARTIGRSLACPSCKSRTWDSDGYIMCFACERNFILINNHHKDGNQKNNSKENIVKLCSDCHSVVHCGLREKDRMSKPGRSNYSRIRKYKKDPKARIILQNLRDKWIEAKEKKNE